MVKGFDLLFQALYARTTSVTFHMEHQAHHRVQLQVETVLKLCATIPICTMHCISQPLS